MRERLASATYVPFFWGERRRDGSAYLIPISSTSSSARGFGLIPALAFNRTYTAAMSGAATSAGASKFQQFMNHPAGQFVPRLWQKAATEGVTSLACTE